MVPAIFCHVYGVSDDFQLAGLGMMLIISLLRYRATVHRLKPAISRRKLKVVCGLVYFVVFIVETTCTRLLLPYSEIYPKSTNFPCLCQHCSLLRNCTYSFVCVYHVVDRW